MYDKIASVLDAVADSLEEKGLIKEAFEIDKIADTIEAAIPYGVDTIVGKALDIAFARMGRRPTNIEEVKSITLEEMTKQIGKGLNVDTFEGYKEKINAFNNLPALLKYLGNLRMAAGGMDKTHGWEE